MGNMQDAWAPTSCPSCASLLTPCGVRVTSYINVQRSQILWNEWPRARPKSFPMFVPICRHISRPDYISAWRKALLSHDHSGLRQRDEFFRNPRHVLGCCGHANGQRYWIGHRGMSEILLHYPSKMFGNFNCRRKSGAGKHNEEFIATNASDLTGRGQFS